MIAACGSTPLGPEEAAGLSTGGTSVAGGTSPTTSEGAGGAGGAGGAVTSTSPAAQSGLVTLASGQNTPYVLAVDARNVYWANWGTYNDLDGSIMRVPIEGGTPMALVPALRAPGGIAAAGTEVYFSGGFASDNAPTLYKVSSAGGTPIALATGVVNDEIALGPHAVYGTGSVSTDGVTIVSVPLAGGAMQAVVPASALRQTFASYGITTDATSVYWTSFSDPCTVMKAPLSGGAPVTLASVPGAGTDIAVDEAYVYFAAGQSVFRVPLAGGTAVTLAATGAMEVAVDETYVYFTDSGSPGTVQKVAKTGGPAILLATDQAYPSGIAVDATSVYWVNAGDAVMRTLGMGSVMRLTPK
jgi:hypothetical protein